MQAVTSPGRGTGRMRAVSSAADTSTGIPVEVILAAYCEAIWSAPSRTLQAGTPAAPSTAAEEYAAAIWQNATRTLTP